MATVKKSLSDNDSPGNHYHCSYDYLYGDNTCYISNINPFPVTPPEANISLAIMGLLKPLKFD